MSEVVSKRKTKIAADDNAANANKKVKKKKKASTKPPWSSEYREKLISQEKIELLDHPAKSKYWIGAKDAGKTRPVVVDEITALEENPRAQGLSLKKYKGGGVVRLHQAVNNIALEIKELGYNIPPYEKGINESYRMKNKRRKTVNQQIEYASFDDANGLAGIVAKNNGYFKVVHIEEPVLIDDEGKLPTPKEWDAAIKTIEDSVNRSNRDYMMLTGNNTGTVNYHYTMNAWDNHPIIDRAEVFHPERKFLSWVQEDMLVNHTKAVYNKQADGLYIRMTKFANPVINAIETLFKKHKVKNMSDLEFKISMGYFDDDYVEYSNLRLRDEILEGHLKDNQGVPILHQAEQAIIRKDSYELARLLGMKYEGSAANSKTYNIDKIVKADTNALLKASNRVIGFCVAWDIDHRRQAVATPVYVVERDDLSILTRVQNVVVRPQIKLPMYGDDGRKVENYIKKMQEINMKLYKDMLMYSKGKQPGMRFMYLDDDRSQYIPFLRNNPLNAPLKARKQGDWGIIKRQDNLQLGVDMGYYIFDYNNISLFDNLKKSITKEGSKKRDEAGKLEKDYDEINSLEYALFPFRYLMFHQGLTIGKPTNYIKEKKDDESIRANEPTR